MIALAIALALTYQRARPYLLAVPLLPLLPAVWVLRRVRR